MDMLPWMTSATPLVRDAPQTLVECVTSKLDSVHGRTWEMELTIQTGL